jgi:quinoprotein glucose dehydrogenase
MAVLAAFAGTVAAIGICLPLLQAHAAESQDHTTWSEYEGSADSSHYSSLTQINKSNVSTLQQAWFYPTGNNGVFFGSNPIVVDDVMYVIGKGNSIVALNAATGKEIWVHENGNPQSFTGRGLNYWESKDRSDRRIFFATNNMLHAIDARTGQSIDSFGDHGNVDLREGLGRDPKAVVDVQSRTPGRVFENLLILGSSTGEGYGTAPGDIRAYNVITGKMVWIFHTIPHPGEFGYNTWPKDAWKYSGGVDCWAGFTIDEKRGIAYFPLAAPKYDFYGADRLGANLFGDSLLALDARSGKYLWHFQAIHHDLWDYDFPTAPQLLTIRHNGRKVDVVAQPGKDGFVYIFDRVTGKPIWPIEERPVPKSNVPGEQAWPTQPFPTAPPPFARQSFTAEDVDPYIADPAEREQIRQEVASARNEGLFTPPSTSNTVEMPGNGGGANWGTAAADPASGFFYVQSKNAPSMLKLEPKPPVTSSPVVSPLRGHVLYIQNCEMCHQAELQGQPPGVPALADAVTRIGAGRIRATITNGSPPMPAFPDLASPELDSLVAYLANPAGAKLTPQQIAQIKALPPPVRQPAQANDAATVRYWSGYGYMDSSDGFPAVKPPWSNLTAYDLNTGTIAWQIPLGENARLAQQGITDTGSYWPRGGVALTAGGLIFSGTKSDSKFRVYDKDTGKVLWVTEMPAAPEGIPAIYEVHGREYVVISARPGTILSGTPAGTRQNSVLPSKPLTPGVPFFDQPALEGYYAFALPSTNAAIH